MIERIASTMITGAAAEDAPGNSGRQMAIMPNVPTLSSTPTSSVEVPGGACPAASGTSTLLVGVRSEEHTSELQSRGHLVCRLLLEKKKNMRRDCIWLNILITML